MRARLCSFIIQIQSPNIGTDLFSWQRQLKGLRVEPIMMHEVAPSMILKNISPFKAISGPLRAFNLIGALPLRFRQDVCGKTRVRHLKYQSMPDCMELNPILCAFLENLPFSVRFHIQCELNCRKFC